MNSTQILFHNNINLRTHNVQSKSSNFTLNQFVLKFRNT